VIDSSYYLSKKEKKKGRGAPFVENGKKTRLVVDQFGSNLSISDVLDLL
jgi:hypothetical protein